MLTISRLLIGSELHRKTLEVPEVEVLPHLRRLEHAHRSEALDPGLTASPRARESRARLSMEAEAALDVRVHKRADLRDTACADDLQLPRLGVERLGEPCH